MATLAGSATGAHDAGLEDEWAVLLKHEALMHQKEKQEEVNKRKAESQRVKGVLDAQVRTDYGCVY